ncbi:MAG: ABC transporter permease [Thermomicrobiales bacterium]|nr:ABC transporter permease [Thermomicrobiales bacterium]
MATSNAAKNLMKDGQTSRRRTGWRRAVYLYRRDLLGMLGLIGLVILAILGLLAPILITYPGAYGRFDAINLGPSRGYWFGTDEMGRSIFDQTIYGIRSSFYVAAFATVIATLVGIIVGMLSGFFSGPVGEVFTGIIDVFLTLPLLPMMILLASVLSPGLTTTGIVVGVFAWPATARIVRAEVIRLRNTDYVEAAHVVGVNNSRILRKHILPNAAPPIFINLSFVAGSAILAEAGLAFLGLGDPTNWSWGTILSHAQASGRFLESWWYATFPSLFIAITVVSLNLFGQAMNEVLNPRLGKQ